MPQHQRKQLKHNADFDVLSTDPETTATIIKERLDAKLLKIFVLQNTKQSVKLFLNIIEFLLMKKL